MGDEVVVGDVVVVVEVDVVVGVVMGVVDVVYGVVVAVVELVCVVVDGCVLGIKRYNESEATTNIVKTRIMSIVRDIALYFI